MTNKNYKDLEVYFDLMLANGASSLYRIVQDMGMLDSYHLEDRFSAKELAEKNNFMLIPTQVLLENLLTMGLLNKKDNLYSLSKVMYFLSGNYKKLSDEYWAHLPTLLRTGVPFKKMDTIENSEMEYQVQVKSLEWMMSPCAEFMVNKLNEIDREKKIKKDVLNILDVGAGSGVWSFNFLYANPKAICTLADWPAVLKVAKDTATKHQIIDKINFIEGNFHQTNFGSARFDYATLGNVTHIQSPDENKCIFKKIFDVLLPGGKLVILDAYGEVPNGALARSLYQMGLTIRTVQGRVYMPEELKPWLSEIGFKSFEFYSLEAVPYSMGMLIAKK